MRPIEASHLKGEVEVEGEIGVEGEPFEAGGDGGVVERFSVGSEWSVHGLQIVQRGYALEDMMFMEAREREGRTRENKALDVDSAYSLSISAGTLWKWYTLG